MQSPCWREREGERERGREGEGEGEREGGRERGREGGRRQGQELTSTVEGSNQYTLTQCRLYNIVLFVHSIYTCTCVCM